MITKYIQKSMIMLTLICKKEEISMASEKKKRKAKNSYLHNGNEAQKVRKMKRTAYYIKADRRFRLEKEE